MDPQTFDSIESLAHFPREQLEMLAECARLEQREEGALLFQAGDASFEPYLLLSGHLLIRRETPYGAFPLGEIVSNELFGEASFVDRRPRSGDAVAQGEVICVRLDPARLTSTGSRDSRFDLALYWTLWHSLSRKLRGAIDHLTRFFPPPEEAAETTGRGPEDRQNLQVELQVKRALFSEQTLSDLEINFLATLSRAQRIQGGSQIFSEGDKADRMYVVLDGEVRISKHIPGAGEEALAVLGRGEYFGEMALIDDMPRSADARAHRNGAVILGISQEVVSGLLDIEKFSSIRLLKIFCGLASRRLREVDDKLIGWYMMSGDGSAPDFHPPAR